MIVEMIRWLVWALAITSLAVSFAPYLPGDYWWARMWDFPRVQITVVVLVGIAAAVLIGARIPVVLMAVAATVQIVQIIPLTPLVPIQTPLVEAGDAETVHALALNVLMENDDYQRTTDLITSEDPDIILLMETDKTWADAMADTLSRYPVVVSYPEDDHYGLIFATRLTTEKAEVVFLTNGDTPAVVARLRTAQGRLFNYVGLHPRPPVPGTSAEERDEQIRQAATLADSAAAPTVVMGDFNDVAWSHTARRYKEIGGFSDPRVGRGLLASFDANRWWMRFPIDHLYITDNIDLISFKRGPHVGSDHFPMLATIAIPDQN